MITLRFRLFGSSLFAFSVLPLAATPVLLENFEGIAPGSPDPNFGNLRSNHPAAVMAVQEEIQGSEIFGPGNRRFLRLSSLSGINPDAPGTPSQFHGGATSFIPFPSGEAQVVSAGFDFRVGPLHSELLFGIGEPQQNRTDDQHFAAQIRLRGVLGLSNRPEIAVFGGNIRADIQEGVPYRVELVANQSGAPIVYEGPLGPRTLENNTYDIYLFDYRYNIQQLIIADAPWGMTEGGQPRRMRGFWLATYRYDATGRSLDVDMDNFAVYENDIVLTGFDTVPIGPASAVIDFEDEAARTDAAMPLWNLPGNIVADSSGVFGSQNQHYFHINRRNIPDGGTSNRFRFNGFLSILSFGFDFVMVGDANITGFASAHDEAFIAVTGGDTSANAGLTFRINFRGTRSVGNDGNPAEAVPQLVITSRNSEVGPRSLSNVLEWNRPYRIEVVLNQSGETIEYRTPWQSAPVSLADETAHVYVYDYLSGDNMSAVIGRGRPYVMEAEVLNGRINDNNVTGKVGDLFWKHVTGRRLDLKLDNISIYENAAVVTNPGAVPQRDVEILHAAIEPGIPRLFQSQTRDRFMIEFASEPGLTYGISTSRELTGAMRPIKTIIPADSMSETTTLDIAIEEDSAFFRLHPLMRSQPD